MSGATRQVTYALNAGNTPVRVHEGDTNVANNVFGTIRIWPACTTIQTDQHLYTGELHQRRQQPASFSKVNTRGRSRQRRHRSRFTDLVKGTPILDRQKLSAPRTRSSTPHFLCGVRRGWLEHRDNWDWSERRATPVDAELGSTISWPASKLQGVAEERQLQSGSQYNISRQQNDHDGSNIYPCSGTTDHVHQLAADSPAKRRQRHPDLFGVSSTMRGATAAPLVQFGARFDLNVRKIRVTRGRQGFQ